MSKRYVGRYRVRRITAARHEAEKLFHKARDLMELRRHVMKLRWFPDSAPLAGQAIDLDYDKVSGLDGVYELRIDQIGNARNIRVIFLVGDDRLQDPLPCIWILSVFAKKRNDFGPFLLANFRERRRRVMQQYYQEA